VLWYVKVCTTKRSPASSPLPGCSGSRPVLPECSLLVFKVACSLWRSTWRSPHRTAPWRYPASQAPPFSSRGGRRRAHGRGGAAYHAQAGGGGGHALVVEAAWLLFRCWLQLGVALLRTDEIICKFEIPNYTSVGFHFIFLPR
jgi:hypothetical protein